MTLQPSSASEGEYQEKSHKSRSPKRTEIEPKREVFIQVSLYIYEKWSKAY